MPSAASSRPRPAKAATSSMKKRRGEVAQFTRVWMGRSSAAGQAGADVSFHVCARSPSLLAHREPSTQENASGQKQ
jgi:hypothetical protein